MEGMKTFRTTTQTSSASPRTSSSRFVVLNVLIGVLALVVVVMAYSFVSRHLLHPPVDAKRSGGGVIQLDVLNGCGASGAASTITAYLRSRGYDVVEIHNYKTFDVAESMVIDRTGNRREAEKVAAALGIREGNIVVQISPDYYVDVSLVIGKDYSSLKPLQ
jgi:hypothetical protein